MPRIQTHSEIETHRLGERLGGRLCAGDVVVLSGELGAGKSVLARGIARGMGIMGPMTSPTFTLVNEYEGRLPFYHFDLYRLSGHDDLIDIGWEDYLARAAVIAVEWSERAEPPGEGIMVYINTTPDGREITIDRIDDTGA